MVCARRGRCGDFRADLRARAAGHKNKAAVMTVAFSAKHALLASGGADGVVRVWGAFHRPIAPAAPSHRRTTRRPR